MLISLFLIVAPMDLTSPSKLSNQHFRNIVHVLSEKYLIRSRFAGKYGEKVYFFKCQRKRENLPEHALVFGLKNYSNKLLQATPMQAKLI